MLWLLLGKASTLLQLAPSLQRLKIIKLGIISAHEPLKPQTSTEEVIPEHGAHTQSTAKASSRVVKGLHYWLRDFVVIDFSRLMIVPPGSQNTVFPSVRHCGL